MNLVRNNSPLSRCSPIICENLLVCGLLLSILFGCSSRAQSALDSEAWSAEREARARALRLSRQQVIILASIIQAEAGPNSNQNDMGLISSVLHNRLAIDLPLQCDSTVAFALTNSSKLASPNELENLQKKISKKDLSIPSPYNTYLNKGLPPGPILTPSSQAIDSALNPANTSYLYYLYGKDGRFHFSETLRDHKAALAH